MQEERAATAQSADLIRRLAENLGKVVHAPQRRSGSAPSASSARGT